MTNLISRAIAYVNSLLKGFQVKSLLSVVLVGLIMLTTNVASADNNKGLKEKVKEDIEQNDAQRPKTVGQWYKDARQTNDAPGERAKKIGQQSAEAFKEFGSGYVEGAKNTASDVGESAAEAGKDISRQVGR
jgi:hypothetical protein